MFGAIFSALGRAVRKAREAIVRGVEAVANVGRKVVGVVKDGWQAVKQAVKRVVERVIGPLDAPTRKVAQAERAVVREMPTVKVERKPQSVVPVAVTEVQARVPVAPASKETFPLPQHAVRRPIAPDLQARFTALAGDVRVGLQALLASDEVHDFADFARLDMSLKMLDTVRQRLERDTADASITLLANRAVDLLQRLIERRELTAEEWSALEDLGMELWGQSLLRRGVESVFMLWTSEYRGKRARSLELGRRLDDLDARARMLGLERAKGRITAEQKAELDGIPEQMSVAKREQEGSRKRLTDLKRVVGVSEGMLTCLEGSEEEADLVAEAEEISPLLLTWNRGQTLSTGDIHRLDAFALAYESRATDRLRHAFEEVEVEA